MPKHQGLTASGDGARGDIGGEELEPGVRYLWDGEKLVPASDDTPFDSVRWDPEKPDSLIARLPKPSIEGESILEKVRNASVETRDEIVQEAIRFREEEMAKDPEGRAPFSQTRLGAAAAGQEIEEACSGPDQMVWSLINEYLGVAQ